MKLFTEAIYFEGVLKSCEPLSIPEGQHVRVTIESIFTPEEMKVSRRKLIEGMEKLHLRTNGRLPTREELHERD